MSRCRRSSKPADRYVYQSPKEPSHHRYLLRTNTSQGWPYLSRATPHAERSSELTAHWTRQKRRGVLVVAIIRVQPIVQYTRTPTTHWLSLAVQMAPSGCKTTCISSQTSIEEYGNLISYACWKLVRHKWVQSGIHTVARRAH